MAVYSLLFLMAINAATLHSILAASVEEMLFESFVSNYSRSYRGDPAVMNERFRVFQQSLARQKMLNEYEREHGGKAVYGINRFSDLTPKEFKARYLSSPRQLPKRKTGVNGGEILKSRRTSIDHVDWREKGVIGAIRNQNQCGSCWAFAVVETIESVYAINQNQKLNFTLSSQQLISCENSPGLSGCKGGVLQAAFDTLRADQTVVVSEKVYPFESSGGDDPPCKANLPNQGLVLTNYTYFNNAELNELMELVQRGPVTTSVNAVPWQDYVGGIVQHHCTDSYIDHAVQVVGYSSEDDLQYWIVRNTWGEKWGEDGYIRLLRGINMCGIRDEVAAVREVKAVGL